jgi:hypothetical protein
MRVLSKQEATLWCKAHRIALSRRGLPERSDANLRFEIPRDTQKRISLVGQAMKAFEDEPSLLVWFDDWSVWPSGQRMHVFDRFRMSYGETRPLIESPAHLFDQTEIEDATSFVTFAALFLWDCYVTNPNRSKLLYFSHDEYGLTKGIQLPEGVKVRRAAGDRVRPRVLPVWSTDFRETAAGDPIGCPVSVGEMVEYVNPLLPFSVQPGNLEFIQKGQLEGSFLLALGVLRRRWASLEHLRFLWPRPARGIDENVDVR